MPDHKKWFKVWTSVLTDVSFNDIGLEDIGRWMLLGAMISEHGNGGKITIKPPAKMMLNLFRDVSISALKVSLKRLPNVHLEEGLNDNDTFTVIIKNWRKYQVDSTSYERLKRSRSKRRGEENREEEKRGDEKALSSFVSLWQQKTAQERQAGAAQIAEGLKAFGLGFRVADDLYKKIMGEEKNGTVRGKSISEQVAEQRAKERSQKARDLASDTNRSSGTQSPGQIFARVRDLPKIPPQS